MTMHKQNSSTTSDKRCESISVVAVITFAKEVV